ncbi:MAG: rhodanese-like domain-containing protein [Proteobacteria bacterium]|nr:rhodanese-like domain-containing protein [Pseudomonadota bacterium]MBU1585405.1 rhodanese-like domain-containing protein [Pseudomonadota bacterium]MBU2452013.1 rhodanese-like domain-containing protein [Pseudomonadota bacterium]MBU2630309.1 rhodanese-like domain-containing protein [Pseudomonadota bacterium]
MKSIKKYVSGFVVVLGVLIFTLPAHAFLGSDKFKQEVEKEQAAVKLVREVQKGAYDVVTAAELKKWMDEKKDMVIIDTMPYEASYKKAHVPGAVQFLFPIPDMPEWDQNQTDQKPMAAYEKLLGNDKDKVIVVYCGFVKCTRSHNGAFWAKKLGYKNVFRFSGGIYAWKGADLEVETE